MTDRKGRRVTRFSFVVALALAPAFALVWSGCGDDDAAPPRTTVDPGGTWGAEVSVTVVGRGRVISTTPGVDCPSGKCFTKYVFPSNAADGATGGLQLQASPTSGARFLGWTFEPVEIGARGRGPDNCNPVKRTSTIPSGSTTDPSLTLPYGEVEGTPPTGQESACAAFKKVPLAYKVTATFDAELPDVDAGADAGAEEILFTAPSGAVASGLGLTSLGYLYWHYDTGGSATIAVASSPNGTLPASVQPVDGLANLQSFRVGRNGVVYSDLATVYAFRSTNPTSKITVGSLSTLATSCRTFAIDTASNVYCRGASTLVRWPFNGTSYGAPVVLYGSGVPNGTNLVVESSFGPVYVDGPTGIVALPLDDTDGGVAAPSTVVASSGTIQRLESSSLGFIWGQNSQLYTTASKAPGTLPLQASNSALSVLTTAQDSSSTWIVAASNGLYLVPSASSAATFRTGTSFTSAAATPQYVFWTSVVDGRVRRARRF